MRFFLENIRYKFELCSEKITFKGIKCTEITVIADEESLIIKKLMKLKK